MEANEKKATIGIIGGTGFYSGDESSKRRNLCFCEHPGI